MILETYLARFRITVNGNNGALKPLWHLKNVFEFMVTILIWSKLGPWNKSEFVQEILFRSGRVMVWASIFFQDQIYHNIPLNKSLIEEVLKPYSSFLVPINKDNFILMKGNNKLNCIRLVDGFLPSKERSLTWLTRIKIIFTI